VLRPSSALDATPVAPHDPSLPGAEALVSPAYLANWILPPGTGDADRVTIEAVRYKPGARLTVVASHPHPTEDGAPLRVALSAYRTGEDVRSVAKRRAAGIPEHALLHDPSRAIMGWRMPYDPSLPGLVHLDGERERAVLIRRLVPRLSRPETRLRTKTLRTRLLRYKPGRHAVLLLEFAVRDARTREKTPGRLVARILPPGETPRPERASLPPDRIPTELGGDPHRGIHLEEHLPGMTVEEALSADPHLDLAPVAEALAALHRPVDRPVDDRLPAADAVAFLAAEPELGDRARRVVDKIGRRIPAHPAPARLLHGDLHPGQILLDHDTARFVDLDRVRPGPAERDLGDLRIALLADANARPTRPPEAGDRLLAAYPGPIDDELLRLHEALAATERAAAPRRNLRASWREDAAAWLELAEDRSRG